MSENYMEAALRHWRDAELLKTQNRVENADQLYGITAECAVKLALSSSPGCTSKGVLREGYRKHIDVLWDKIPVQSLAKRFPCLPALASLANPYQDWRIDQRYDADGSVQAPVVESHREIAKRLLGAVHLIGSRAP